MCQMYTLKKKKYSQIFRDILETESHSQHSLSFRTNAPHSVPVIKHQERIPEGLALCINKVMMWFDNPESCHMTSVLLAAGLLGGACTWHEDNVSRWCAHV